MNSKFNALYKNNTRIEENQAERRQQLLNQQKEKRNQKFLENRGILELVAEDDYISPRQSQRSTKNLLYKDKLQLSEWMTEKLEYPENWYLVPCVKGIRCLLVKSEKRRALVYFKKGYFFKEFKSNLPPNTILDCFFNETTKTFYIIDLLLYAGQDFTTCEFQFRHFWIKNKLVEDDWKILDSEDYKLENLVCHDVANFEEVERCLENYPAYENNEPELDGILFYHKESHYVHGKTPLVLWLFPFMIPELFPDQHFNINPMYLKERPANYTNYLEYIREFDENAKTRSRKFKKNQKDSSMELGQEEEEEELIDDGLEEMTSQES